MRLIVVVEGQTEEDFVDKVLKPHLLDRNIHVSATIVGKLVAQDRGHRSRGGGHFKHWRADIARILAACSRARRLNGANRAGGAWHRPLRPAWRTMVGGADQAPAAI